MEPYSETLLKQIEGRTASLKQRIEKIGCNAVGPYSEFAHLLIAVLCYEEAFVIPRGGHRLPSHLVNIRNICMNEGVRGDNLKHFLRTSFPLLEEEVRKLMSH